jgi:hypothetical protein
LDISAQLMRDLQSASLIARFKSIDALAKFVRAFTPHPLNDHDQRIKSTEYIPTHSQPHGGANVVSVSNIASTQMKDTGMGRRRSSPLRGNRHQRMTTRRSLTTPTSG